MRGLLTSLTALTLLIALSISFLSEGDEEDKPPDSPTSLVSIEGDSYSNGFTRLNEWKIEEDVKKAEEAVKRYEEEQKRIKEEEKRLEERRLEEERQEEEARLQELERKKKEEAVTSKEVATTSQSNNAGGWKTFEATYYGPDCIGCSGITATGLDVRNSIHTSSGHRVIAVDPNQIPLGSTVEVQTPNESFTAVAADTGGAIKGRIVDILVNSEAESYKYGRHSVKLRIIQ